MNQLTNDEITKNSVDTLNQFKVLNYLKENLNIYAFDIFLYDKDTIKVIDKNQETAYFTYNEDKKEILFSENNKESSIEI